MSSSRITELGVLSDSLGNQSLREVVAEPVTRIAFWSAIVLPFLYIPLLATGLDSRSMVLTFLLLVVLNAAALLVGHRYDRE